MELKRIIIPSPLTETPKIGSKFFNRKLAKGIIKHELKGPVYREQNNAVNEYFISMVFYYCVKKYYKAAGS